MFYINIIDDYFGLSNCLFKRLILNMSSEFENKQIVSKFSWNDLTCDQQVTLTLNFLFSGIESINGECKQFKRDPKIFESNILESKLSSFIGKKMNLLMNFFPNLTRTHTLINYLDVLCKMFSISYNNIPYNDPFFAEAISLTHKMSKKIKKNITRKNIMLPTILFKTYENKKIVENTILYLIKYLEIELDNLSTYVFCETDKENNEIFGYRVKMNFLDPSTDESRHLSYVKYYLYNLVTILTKIEEALRIVNMSIKIDILFIKQTLIK